MKIIPYVNLDLYKESRSADMVAIWAKIKIYIFLFKFILKGNQLFNVKIATMYCEGRRKVYDSSRTKIRGRERGKIF